jgi:hypothetical protein
MDRSIGVNLMLCEQKTRTDVTNLKKVVRQFFLVPSDNFQTVVVTNWNGPIAIALRSVKVPRATALHCVEMRRR